MYNNAKSQEPETIVEPVVEEPVAEPAADVQMAIEGVAEPEVIAESDPDILSAIVVGCAKLNVREEPSPRATVVAIIDASNEVVINEDESFGNYYKVLTASGIEGYCIKDYLELK
jgi:uncharacterized protein YgiM (DUF1202 family)